MATNETKTAAGTMLVLMHGERSVTRHTEGGGAVAEYPDVYLAEKPPGGIWGAYRVRDETIVRLSPLTLTIVSDEDAQKWAAEDAERRASSGSPRRNRQNHGRGGSGADSRGGGA